MTYQSSLVELIQTIENIGENKKTGQIIIRAENIDAQINFLNGKLMYINEVNNRIRRQERAFKAYINKKVGKIEIKESFCGNLWESELLQIAIASKKLRLERVKKFLQAIITEFLCELSVVQNFHFRWESCFKRSPNNDNSSLPLHIGLSSSEFIILMKKALIIKDRWQTLGNTRTNLDKQSKFNSFYANSFCTIPLLASQ